MGAPHILAEDLSQQINFRNALAAGVVALRADAGGGCGSKAAGKFQEAFSEQFRERSVQIHGTFSSS
jgi:hypothetical protein